MVISYRLGVDWDGDGWINWGVAEGTPPNLFPKPLYGTRSKLRGLQYSTGKAVYQDIRNVSDTGLMERRVKLGRDAQGDYAEKIRFGFEDYGPGQQKAGDPLNLIAGSYQNSYPYTRSGSVVGDANGSYLTFGMDYKVGAIQQYQATGFIDGSNQYTKAVNGAAGSLSGATTYDFDLAIGRPGGGTSTYASAQSFTLANGGWLTQVSFVLGATAGTPGAIQVGLSTGASAPTGAPGSTLGTIASPTQNATNTLTLATPVYLKAGTRYWVTIAAPSASLLNYYRLRSNTLGQLAGENLANYSNSAWIASSPNDAAITITYAIATTTINEIAVTAGQTYTLAYNVTANSGTSYVRIYGNGGASSSPNFGRTYINGAPITGTGNKTLTFTVPVGVSYVGFDFQTTSGLSVQDYMLLVGSVSHPGYLYDPSVGYDFYADLFAVVVPANSPYVVSFWARSTDGVQTLTGALYGASSTDIYTLDSHTLTLSSTWTRYTFAVASKPVAMGLFFEWTATKGGSPTGLNNVGNVDFRGYQITAGTDTYIFHTNEATAAYDDLTDDAIRVETKSGKNSFYEALPFEGTMAITLDNTARLYSPENSGSPLYGAVGNIRRVVLQVNDGTSWQYLWSGWTTGIDIAVGATAGSLTATLSCEQGLFRLRRGSFGGVLELDTNMSAVATRLIESSAWQSASSPYRSAVGFAMVGENGIVLDTPALFGQLDTGVNRLELVGQDWGRKSNVADALKELLDSENAKMWIARDGALYIVDRTYWVDLRTPYAIDIDSAVQQADYVYGDKITTRSEVIINRRRIQTGQAVWKTHRAFKVMPRKNPTDKVEIEIHAERQDGRQKTIIKYTLDGMTKTVYTTDPTADYSKATTASTDVADKVTVQLIPYSAGNLYHLRVTNDSSAPVWVDIELKGDYLDTEDGTPVITENESAIEEQDVVDTYKASTGVLDSLSQADAMGGFYVLYGSEVTGEFTSIVFNDAALDANISRLTAVTLGSYISLSEYQTAETDRNHWVIGEDISIIAGKLTVTYHLAKAFSQSIFHVGDKLALSTVNYVPSQDNIVPVYGTKVVTNNGVKKIVKGDAYTAVNTPAMAVLDPAEGQVQTFKATSGWRSGVAAISAGGLFFVPPAGAPMVTPGINQYGAYENGSGVAAQATGRLMLPTSTKYMAIVFASSGFGGTAYGFGVQTGTSSPVYYQTDNTGTADAFYRKMTFTTPSVSPAKQVTPGEVYGWLDFQDISGGGIFGDIELIRMSGARATSVSTGSSHVYTAFVQKVNDGLLAPISVTLTVYGYDGAVIGTATNASVGNTSAKLEVEIPAGNKFVWATLSSTKDVYLLGYGVTDASVTQPSDLLVAQKPSIIFA